MPTPTIVRSKSCRLRLFKRLEKGILLHRVHSYIHVVFPVYPGTAIMAVDSVHTDPIDLIVEFMACDLLHRS